MKYILFLSMLVGVSACKIFSQETNDVKIAGGQVVNNWSYLEVVKVVTDARNNITCAGVVVSKNSLMMPAHCYKKNETAPGNFYAIFKEIFHYPKHVELFHGLADTSTVNQEAAKRDIAIVIFQSDVFQSVPTPVIRTTPLKKGEQFRIFGFGSDSFDINQAKISSSKQELRRGENSIFYASKDLNYSFFKFDRDSRGNVIYQNAKALAAPGDSGGPVFDSTGRLVGFAVGIYFLKIEGKTDTGSNKYVEMIDNQGKPHLDTKQAVFAVNAFVAITPDSEAAKIITSANKKGANIIFPENAKKLTSADRVWMGAELSSNPKSARGSWVALASGYEYLSTSSSTTESLSGIRTTAVPNGVGLPNHPSVGPVQSDFDGEEEHSILEIEDQKNDTNDDEKEDTEAEKTAKEQEEKDRLEKEKAEKLKKLISTGNALFANKCQGAGCHDSAAGRSKEEIDSTGVPPRMVQVVKALSADERSALEAFLDTQ